MQNNFGSAITHVQSGLKILSEVKYNEKSRNHQHPTLRNSEMPYVAIKTIEETFARIDLQAIQVKLPYTQRGISLIYLDD